MLHLNDEVKENILNEAHLDSLLRAAIRFSDVKTIKYILDYSNVLSQDEETSIYYYFRLAIEENTEAVPLLLSFMLKLNKHEKIFDAFTFNYFNLGKENALLYALKKQPKAVIPLLNTIKFFPVEIKHKIFTSRSSKYRTSLQSAIKRYGDNIKLLTTMLNIIDTLDHETRYRIFIQARYRMCSLLQNNQTKAFSLLLDKITTFPESVQYKIFDSGFLFAATKHQPTFVRRLLLIFNNWANDKYKSFDAGKDNPLTSAIAHNPQLVFDFVDILPPVFILELLCKKTLKLIQATEVITALQTINTLSLTIEQQNKLRSAWQAIYTTRNPARLFSCRAPIPDHEFVEQLYSPPPPPTVSAHS